VRRPRERLDTGAAGRAIRTAQRFAATAGLARKDAETANGEIGFWDYPGGGAAVKTIPIGGSSLVGVTISVAPRQ